MIRIGMIGADSTHTEAWTQLVNPPGGLLHGQAQVVKLWGEDADQARAKANDLQIPAVVDTPADVLSDVDLVMVVNRYGDDHPPHARLAIEAGLPTFVDKPFANDIEDVHSLVSLAAQQDVPLMSCSALRYAVEVMALQEKMAGFGALNCAVISGAAAGDFPDPRAKHPFFYGIHAIELLHTLLGGGAEAVTTRRTDRCDIGMVHYADGRQGVVNLLHKTPGFYHGAVFGAQGWGEADVVDAERFYSGTLERVIKMAASGEPPFPIAWSAEIMAVMAAMVRSAEENGRTVPLSELLQ
jgi:predicted dehydrogenase